MARYIDADVLTDGLYDGTVKNGGDLLMAMFKVVVDATPTIDAVPVVRCKDCIHYYTNTEIGYPNCEMLKGRFIVKDDWFCADGKRKDGADECDKN